MYDAYRAEEYNVNKTTLKGSRTGWQRPVARLLA